MSFVIYTNVEVSYRPIELIPFGSYTSIQKVAATFVLWAEIPLPAAYILALPYRSILKGPAVYPTATVKSGSADPTKLEQKRHVGWHCTWQTNAAANLA